VHEPFQVFSAEVSSDRIEPSQPLNFSGRIYYNGTTIPAFSGGASLDFDGVDDCVVIADSPSFQISVQITISLWVKTLTSGVFQRVLWKNNAFGLTIYPQGRTRGTACIGKVSEDSNSSNTCVTDGLWHLITYVYDGSQHIIYVDGVLESTRNQTGMIQTSSENLYIGKQEEGSLYPFCGAVDDVRVYNYSLGADEISGIFQGTFENETNMMAHWSFDGDALDKSGNGNDGVVYGASWKDGWANVHVYLELNGLLKAAVSLINSTDGNFVFPQITSESQFGTYKYIIYAANGVQNQTLNVIVEPFTSPKMIILSPKNLTYALDSIPLTLTVDKPVSWIEYSLDGNANITINGNTTIQNLFAGPHYITIYLPTVASETIHFMVDVIPPTIVSTHRLPEGVVTNKQRVTISANVTDIGSGVKEVILSYSVDKGASWNNVTMNYNNTAGVYEETIPRQSIDSFVEYKIIAYDNANSAVIDDNTGKFYSYMVIQEFPALNLLALFILSAIIVVVIINTNKRNIFSTTEDNGSSSGEYLPQKKERKKTSSSGMKEFSFS
jgi:hypothetical protein